MKRSWLPLLTLLLLAGCSSLQRRFSGPDVPPIVLSNGDVVLLKARISCDRKVVAAAEPLVAGNTTTCTIAASQSVTVPETMTEVERNEVQGMLLSASDQHYFKVRDHLLNSRNALTFSAEVTGVTLSAVSAILGDVDTKTILSTTSSLVQSTKTAIDKDFFAEQASSAIVNTMDAMRADEKTTILKEEGNALKDYGFEQALNDALIYDQEGSVQSALIKLATDAGTKSNNAKSALATQQSK